MNKKVKVLVLRTAGTNCDKETFFAFELAGALPELVHVNELLGGSKKLDDYRILAIPGGFSYGDDIAAGKVLANELKFKLVHDLSKFIQAGKLIIGICNGFQILVKSGLLPGHPGLEQDTSLILNDSAKFEDRWVYLRAKSRESQRSKCVWTRDLTDIIYLPVAHGEGKFITRDEYVLNRLKNNGQIVLRYCDEEGRLAGYPCNPNGSLDNIAGICDETGRILGLMPHPERHVDVVQHPRWPGLKLKGQAGDGLAIFKNGVEYARKGL
ncbi:MAG: phosphoribosylformylglycinamidine synthase I [Candidatus Omnitrophica bacterium]|nr:phosphoribosylformylglycinamidine synthase I [Candidatus Omnitrophota bacterium]MDD5654146.1 phosphoribosylformylglycinamidine synthase I [Candidatus Omnitrophota bacterium]